jgi:myo-inositol 2-dehydrogenase/D-chiro-inositol 1-dehydrogenase/scyllo-inositol 2-dehydrogenase (NAD+)
VAFDVVAITTLTVTYQNFEIEAANAGTRNLFGKPMALNLAECDAIIEAVEQNGVILQLGFIRRFDRQQPGLGLRALVGGIESERV